MPIFQTSLVKKEQGGGGSVSGDDVRFLDYDGTVVVSYSADDFAQLSALPPNPSHTGLTAQGWNWSLSDAKTYVASYGMLDIGQMYTTTSGATEIDVDLDCNGLLSPYCGFAVSGTVRIDWGDGSTSNVTGTSVTTTKNTQHTYATTGKYTIKLIPVGAASYRLVSGSNNRGSYLLHKNLSTSNNAFENRRFQNAITAVRVGRNCGFNNNVFAFCYSLKSVTIPKGITSLGTSSISAERMFDNCTSLSSITIPDSVTIWYGGLFSDCSGLVSISLPKGITKISESSFRPSINLQRIAIPDNVTEIGPFAFSGCTALSRVAIPSGLTTIGAGAFGSCRNLRDASLPSSITGNTEFSAFGGCWALSELDIPNGVTTIGSTGSLYAVRRVSIPNTVTAINGSAFAGSYSLLSITIPSSVASIGSKAFSNCYGLSEIHFERSSPPTVASSDAFLYVPKDCKIYVPAGKLSAYTSATNYPSSSTYTYIEE